MAIDDDPICIMWLEGILNRSDVKCSVHSFTNSMKGIDAIQQEKPDVLLLNIEMPEMNGLDILRLPLDLPNVIAMSSNVAYKDDVLQLNARTFLQKPLSLDLVSA